jgi:hypothetical protein
MGLSITSTPLATPCFRKIMPPQSRKVTHCQSRVQKVRICWHYSPFKIALGIPFAHGTQKRWIVVALWQLSLFKFGDNSGQVALAKHAGPFQWTAWLYSVFKKIDLVRVITKSLLQPRRSQKLQSLRH